MTRVRFRTSTLRALIAGVAGVMSMLLTTAGADAQERPRYGGELVFVVPTEPASYDAHREGTFALVHPLAPVYSTLLRFDPTDRTGTKVVGDLAESWTVAKDGRTYTFKIRRGVKFHDGSDLTSKDVKATYDKIVNPPADVVSFRKGQYTAIEAIEAPTRPP
jgi:peptide/nickel transport system substrate-binding protein